MARYKDFSKELLPLPTIEKIIYAGKRDYIEPVIEELMQYRPGYPSRLLHFVFIDSGLVAPKVDWSAYDGDPLFTDEQLWRVACGVSKESAAVMRALAVFLSDVRNIRWLVNRLPDKERALWRKCLINGSVKEKEVRAALNVGGPQETFMDNPRYSWLYPTSWSIQQARWSWGSRKPELEFVIDSVIRPYLVAVFFPDASDFPRLETLPEGLTTFGDENGAIRGVARYEAVAGAGMFDSISSNVTMAVVRKVSAAMELKEFFPDDGGNKYKVMARGRIVANLLSGLSKVDDLSSMSGAERWRYAVNNVAQTVPDIVRRALMPQLRGKFAHTSFDYSAYDIVKTVMRMIGRQSDGGRWVEAKGFIDFFKLLYGDQADVMLIDNYGFDRCDVNVKSGSDGKSHRVALDERFMYLIVPLIQGTVFMLAAAGALEVAFDSREPVSCSPFGGLRYWRLTRLGRFVLGLDSRYESEVEISSVNDFVLDDSHLVITVSNVHTSMRGLLDRFAKPVSATRYAVTPSTFLRHCRNINDINRTIGLIRDFVCTDPPKIWIEFFEEMRRRASAVSEDTSDYMVYRINPADKELQRYLAMSPEMRDLAICAQGFRVLVEMANDARFRELLLARGYLL